MHPIFWVLIAFVLGFSAGGGFAAGNAKRSKSEVNPLAPVCRCDHEYTSHRNGGQCGEWQEMFECACTAYLGPDPMITGLWQHPNVLNKQNKKATE